MIWADGRIAAFDVETTSPEPEDARIVTAAVALCGGGRPTESLVLLADPGVPIPEQATAIHGVTTERARMEGRSAREVIATVIDALAGLPAECPIVAMNARFDLTVADREARRHGIVPLVDRRRLLVVDPLVVDKHLDRFRRGSRKLDALCAHYGAELESAHDAAADAVAAARLAWVIAKRGQVVRRVRNAAEGRELARLREQWERIRGDLPALHAAQVEWAFEQARGLEEYFARKGTPERVQPEWPLVTWREQAMA